MCPVVGLLGHMIILFLVSKGISMLFSIVAIPVYILINHARDLLFSTPYHLTLIRMAIIKKSISNTNFCRSVHEPNEVTATSLATVHFFS